MIICKSPREIEIMREAGKIVALTHQELQKYIAPGISTKELDTIAEKFIRGYDAIPSLKGIMVFAVVSVHLLMKSWYMVYQVIVSY